MVKTVYALFLSQLYALLCMHYSYTLVCVKGGTRRLNLLIEMNETSLAVDDNDQNHIKTSRQSDPCSQCNLMLPNQNIDGKAKFGLLSSDLMQFVLIF